MVKKKIKTSNLLREKMIKIKYSQTAQFMIIIVFLKKLKSSLFVCLIGYVTDNVSIALKEFSQEFIFNCNNFKLKKRAQ